MHPALIAAGAAVLAAPLLLLGGGGASLALASVVTAPAVQTAPSPAMDRVGVVVDGSNGRLDESTMCRSTISVGGSMGLLQCGAAADLDRLAVAYEEAMGKPLCFGNGYRNLGQQVRLKAAKPGLAARAGTSQHGWGLAVDFCGGIERFGTREHQWFVQNSPAYNWIHPRWAQRGGSRPEAWHHEWTP